MGITDDSDLTMKLLENAHENATFKFGTGYFNLTQEYLHVILHKSKAKFDLVTKSMFSLALILLVNWPFCQLKLFFFQL